MAAHHILLHCFRCSCTCSLMTLAINSWLMTFYYKCIALYSCTHLYIYGGAVMKQHLQTLCMNRWSYCAAWKRTSFPFQRAKEMHTKAANFPRKFFCRCILQKKTSIERNLFKTFKLRGKLKMKFPLECLTLRHIHYKEQKENVAIINFSLSCDYIQWLLLKCEKEFYLQIVGWFPKVNATWKKLPGQ